MRTEYFTAADGTRLVCSIWDNVKNPVGVVQIIHGMDEHVRRYDRFAKFLNKNGYIVFGDDHRGHGRTAKSIFKIGMPDGATDIFAETVSDAHEIMRWLKSRYNLPVFVFGHSYGSFIAQRVMEESDVAAAGVCLAGGAKYPTFCLGLARIIAWCGTKLFGADAPARFLEFWSPTRGKTRGSDKLSRDVAQQNARKDDEYRAKHFSWGFYFSLFKNMMRLNGDAPRDLPLLIISGDGDPIGMNGRLARRLYRMYKNHGMKNLTVIIYPDARHELLMDLNYDQVQNDIVEFLNSVAR